MEDILSGGIGSVGFVRIYYVFNPKAPFELNLAENWPCNDGIGNDNDGLAGMSTWTS